LCNLLVMTAFTTLKLQNRLDYFISKIGIISTNVIVADSYELIDNSRVAFCARDRSGILRSLLARRYSV
jgi:hypothetical protein